MKKQKKTPAKTKNKSLQFRLLSSATKRIKLLVELCERVHATLKNEKL